MGPLKAGTPEPVQGFEQQRPAEAASAVGGDHAKVLNRTNAAAFADALDGGANRAAMDDEPGRIRLKSLFAANLPHQVGAAVAARQAGKDDGVDFLGKALGLDLGVGFDERVIPGHPGKPVRQRFGRRQIGELDLHTETLEIRNVDHG